MSPMASLDFATGTATNKVRSRVAKKRVDIEAKHKQAKARKKEKVRMLTALVAMKDGTETTPAEHEELAALKRRLRIAEHQLAVMR